VKHRKLDLGVMITASHNPGEYNGSDQDRLSGAAGSEVTRAVEALLGKSRLPPSALASGIEVGDCSAEYVKFIRSYLDLKRIRRRRFKIIVDAMYGAGDSFIGTILKGTDIRVEFLRNTINPSFGGKHPSRSRRTF